jgi:hypothetical protein
MGVTDVDRRAARDLIEATEQGCPHCLSRTRTCHVCHGTGRVTLRVAFATVGWTWATFGCPCDGCREAGPQPRDVAALPLAYGSRG